jgi:hypothetical protein
MRTGVKNLREAHETAAAIVREREDGKRCVPIVLQRELAAAEAADAAYARIVGQAA